MASQMNPPVLTNVFHLPFTNPSFKIYNNFYAATGSSSSYKTKCPNSMILKT